MKFDNIIEFINTYKQVSKIFIFLQLNLIATHRDNDAQPRPCKNKRTNVSTTKYVSTTN